MAEGEDTRSLAAEVMEQLYCRHRDSAYRTALAILGDRDEAEDAVQQALTKLPHDLTDRVHESKHRRYVTTAAGNKAISILHRRGHTVSITDTLANALITPDAQMPDRRAEEAILRRMLGVMIGKLPPRCAAVAGLAAQGNTNREIAAELGVSPKAVEHQKTRAYRLLRQMPEVRALVDFINIPASGRG